MNRPISTAHIVNGPSRRHRTGRLKLLPLVAATYFMVSGGPYGIEDILGSAGYLKALFILAVVPLLWSLPTALMIGELASAIPAEGGFYVWVRRALGPFWGFQEAWLSLTASIFDMAIYPTLFVLYLSRLAPALTAGWRGTLWELAMVAACCIWNLRGAASVGRGAVALFALLLAPFAVLVGAGIRQGWLMRHAGPGHAAFAHGIATAHVWTATPAESNLGLAVLVAMWNYMGWDNASTVAQEVENAPRNYPRAMLISTGLVTLTYMLPLAAMAYAGMPLDRFTTGAWADAATTIAGPALGLAIVAGGMLNGLGMFNALTLSYTRLPMVLAEEGLLPRWLARRNSRGVPWAAVLACSVAWGCALGFSYERLISIDLILYGSSLVLEFVSLLVLRFREPDLPRPFRAGSLPVAFVVALLPMILFAYALYVARTEQLAHMPALVFGVLVALGGVLAYQGSKHLWRQHDKPGAP